MQYIFTYPSPVGELLIASDGTHITGLWMENQKYFASTLRGAKEDAALPVFMQTKEWLDRYFKGENPGTTPPLHPAGTPFRLAVWKILQEIPYGKTMTYREIADRIARQTHKERMSARAVGNAIGHNPISIIIPCHRVVGSNGNLTGYAGGIDKKLRLLDLEGADTGQFFIPQKRESL